MAISGVLRAGLLQIEMCGTDSLISSYVSERLLDLLDLWSAGACNWVIWLAD